jgi:predicted RNA-binding Zn-ribbon protein involved in translation (DUF1610 family)
MSTSITSVPFRTIRNSSGVVTIEKHYSDMNPNCGLGILIMIIAIILPASLVAVAPVASIVLLLGSTLFPGIPLLLVNKMWRIDIDNANRDLKIVRWHDFNKVNKKSIHIKFDEIREIVAETSPDGARRRLVAILLSGTRHVLYETLNMSHADRFKTYFMAGIQLQASQPTAQTPQVTQTTQSQQPAPQGSGPGNPAAVVPSLRQFAIPDPNAPPGDDDDLQGLPPTPPIRVSSWTDDLTYVDDVDDVDAAGDVDPLPGARGGQPAAVSPAAAAPGNQGTGATSKDDDEAVHKRLLEIARRKREVLSRVYQPGSEPQNAPGTPAPAAAGVLAGEGAPPTPLRNKEDWYNKFDNCGGFAYLSSPELGVCRPAGTATASGTIETRTGRMPKKKAGEDDEDEIITHTVDRRTEKELGVHKVRPTCMVCTIPLKGTTFICPTCETKYCIRCAKALSLRKEYCWVCRKPLKI